MPPEAYGFLEKRGQTGLSEATDAMLKAGNVEYVTQAIIGGAYVTTVIRGEVAAVRSAVEQGREAVGELATLHAHHVIPSLNEEIVPFFGSGGAAGVPEVPANRAFGVIETLGFTPGVAAADEALDAAQVVLTDLYYPGGGYTAVMLRGDVAAVRSAVEAGKEAAASVGKVIGSHMIANPHPMLLSCFPMGSRVAPADAAIYPGRALGVIETRGFTPACEAMDRAAKAAQVLCAGPQRVGSAMVAFTFRGDVGAVRAAMAAGIEGAKALGELVSTVLLPGPDPAVEEVMPLPKKKGAGGKAKQGVLRDLGRRKP